VTGVAAPVGRNGVAATAGLLERTSDDLRRHRRDRVWTRLCQAAAALVVAVLGVIILTVVLEGLKGLSIRFFTQEAYGFEDGGALAAILGTLQLVPLATLIAAPIGVLAGLYMAESTDRRLPGLLRTGTETMAGLPSVVVGIFVFTIVVLPMRSYSAFAGVIAIAVIMLPIIARSTEEIVRLVPGSVREASLALGIRPWRTTLSVVIRTAAAGILTAVMLAVARGAGETAPLILTSVGNQSVNVGDLSQPMDSLPTFIYFASGQPSEVLTSQAWAASLVLLAFVLALNVIVRWRTIGRRAA
jgi:phosphate transport system permease protein